MKLEENHIEFFSLGKVAPFCNLMVHSSNQRLMWSNGLFYFFFFGGCFLMEICNLSQKLIFTNMCFQQFVIAMPKMRLSSSIKIRKLFLKGFKSVKNVIESKKYCLYQSWMENVLVFFNFVAHTFLVQQQKNPFFSYKK